MTNSSKAGDVPRKTHPTIAGMLISLCIQIMLLLLFAWLCLILWFVMSSIFKGNDVVYNNVSQLTSYYFRELTTTQSYLKNITWLTPDNIIQRIFINTHFIDTLNSLSQKLSAKLYAFNIGRNGYFACGFGAILLNISQVILTRFTLLLSFLPLIILMLLIGLIDGLSGRDIRKFKALRESTFFFHRLKILLPWVFYLPLFSFFVLPVAISATWFFIPMAMSLGFLTMLSARHFKKYL